MRRRLIFIVFFIIFIVVISTNYTSIDFEKDRYINVEIKGEVKQEKVLTLPLGSKISDALAQIELKDDADISTISNLDTLYNNQIIVIPKISENDLISINSSSLTQLIELPGIGESLAQRIIDYRENVGCFIKLEDLMNVKGIGQSKYNKLKDYICL